MLALEANARKQPQGAVPQPPEARRYKRGYQAPPWVRDRISAAHRTDPVRTALAAIGDHAVTSLAAAMVAGASLVAPWPALCIAVAVAAAVTGRQLRALENLLHEASHFNWSRHRRRLNDRLARWLAGYPTGGRLSAYRAGHLLHHGRFGTEDDPDLRRYQDLSIEALDRTSTARFVVGLLVRLPAYYRDWLRTASGLAVIPPLYASVLALVPAYLLGGWSGLAWATAAWLSGYLMVLPVIRLVAEAGEHRYTGARSVFDATYSNLGRWHRLIFHPHNDGYHTIHHMWPGIPHHQLRRLHNILVVADPAGYTARLRYRTRLLET